MISDTCFLFRFRYSTLAALNRVGWAGRGKGGRGKGDKSKY